MNTADVSDSKDARYNLSLLTENWTNEVLYHRDPDSKETRREECYAGLSDPPRATHSSIALTELSLLFMTTITRFEF